MLRPLTLLTFVFVIALSIAVVSPQTFAEDEVDIDVLPSGIYAEPSCAQPKGIWLIAAGLDILVDDRGSDAERALPLGEVFAHGWRRYHDDFVRVLPNGRIEYLIWDRQHEDTVDFEQLPSTIEILDDDWWGVSYELCRTMPLPYSVLHGETARLLLGLDSILHVCNDGARSDCISALFAVFDLYPDGKLTTAELSRLMRVTLYLAFALDDGADLETMGAQLGISILAAPLVATALISSYDYDADNGLSLSEIGYDLLAVETSVPDVDEPGGNIPAIVELLTSTGGDVRRQLDMLRALGTFFDKTR